MKALLAMILMQSAEIRLRWSEFLGGAEGSMILNSVIYEINLDHRSAVWISTNELVAGWGWSQQVMDLENYSLLGSQW